MPETRVTGPEPDLMALFGQCAAEMMRACACA